jgi:hypothetical protein
MHLDTIREALRRAPFVPFLLRMNDGRVFHVPHPDYVAVGRRHVYYIDPNTDASVFLEPVLIASLEYLGPLPSAPDAGTGGNT